MYRNRKTDLQMQLLLISVVLIGSSAGITYYMDSSTDCSRGVIALDSGIYSKVTVEGRRSSLINRGPLSCTITFKSSGGFEVDFDEGWIRSNGVTLTLYSGTNTSSRALATYTRGSIIPRSDQYYSGPYLTLHLVRTTQSALYDFEVDIKGTYRIEDVGKAWAALSTGIIVAIVIAAIVGLLCCILIPVGVYCCFCKNRSTRHVEAPVTYTVAPSAPPPYSMTYGKPAYMQ